MALILVFGLITSGSASAVLLAPKSMPYESSSALDHQSINQFASKAGKSIRPGVNPVVSGIAKTSRYLTVNNGEWFWNHDVGPFPGFQPYEFQWYQCKKAVKKPTSKRPKNCSPVRGSDEHWIKLDDNNKKKYMVAQVFATTTEGHSSSVFTKSSRLVTKLKSADEKVVSIDSNGLGGFCTISSKRKQYCWGTMPDVLPILFPAAQARLKTSISGDCYVEEFPEVAGNPQRARCLEQWNPSFRFLLPEIFPATKIDGGNPYCAFDLGILCWGRNDDDLLNGFDGNLDYYRTPTGIHGFTGYPSGAPLDLEIVWGAICVLWSNDLLECKHSRRSSGSTAVVRTDITAMSGARGMLCFLTNEGNAGCYRGDNRASIPGGWEPLDKGSGIDISTDGTMGCLVNDGGFVSCWGSNYGDPTQIVPGVTDAVQIEVDDGTACAVIADGTVQCWGANRGGAVGNGLVGEQWTPQEVFGLFLR